MINVFTFHRLKLHTCIFAFVTNKYYVFQVANENL